MKDCRILPNATCKKKENAKCIIYRGPNLPCINTYTYDNLEEIIIRIGQIMCDTGGSTLAENIGSGEGLYFQKVDDTLQFKSLVEGSAISLSSTSDEITISSIYQMSITADSQGLKLINDEASPGNREFYSTTSSGVKGWRILESGDLPTLDNLYWSLTGNTATVVGTNFLGTTDSTSLEFRVNNQRSGYLSYSASTSLGNIISLGYQAVSSFNLALTNDLIGIGVRALQLTVHGGSNYAFGYESMQNTSYPGSGSNTASENIATGYAALRNQTVGYKNAVYGHYIQNITGNRNAIFGTHGFESNNSGSNNASIGESGLRWNILGNFNANAGTAGQYLGTTVVQSVTITNAGSGYTSASITFSAPRSSAIPGISSTLATGTVILSGGAVVGVTITNPGNNYGYTPATATITGDGTGATVTVNLTSAEYNSTLGTSALVYNEYGKQLVAVGNLSGYGVGGNEATYNDIGMTFLGAYSSRHSSIPRTTSLSYGTAIGYGSKIGVNYGVSIGDLTNGLVGLGTAFPAYRLDINGNQRLLGSLGINTAPATAPITIAYTAADDIISATGNVNSFQRISITNSNSGISASSGILLTNNSPYSGVLRMNSSTYTSSGESADELALRSFSTDVSYYTPSTNSHKFYTVSGTRTERFSVGASNVIVSNANFGVGVTPSASFHASGTMKFDLGGDATGDVFYRNSSGLITRLGAGTNGHVLTLASGIPSWAAPAGGGGITIGSTIITGGTDTRILYDNSGVVGESSNFTFNGTSLTLTGNLAISQGVITANVPNINSSVTWNSAGTAFEGIKLVVTNTASASGSKLVAITQGIKAGFWINKDGQAEIFSDNALGYGNYGLKLRNYTNGSQTVLHSFNQGLYITDSAGAASPLTLGIWSNPGDGTTFTASSGRWVINSGAFVTNNALWSGFGQAEVYSTSLPQLGLLYNTSNYFLATVNSSGIVNFKSTGNVITIGGGTTETDLRFLEASGSGSNYVGFKAPSTLAGNTIYTLPTAFPAGTYLLNSTNTGVIGFTDPSSIISQPTNQIVYGTGSGVTSNANGTFDGALMNITGEMQVGGSSLASGFSNKAAEVGTGVSAMGDFLGITNNTRFYVDDPNGQMIFRKSGDDAKVGINTSSPTVALDVQGGAGIVKITSSDADVESKLVLNSNGVNIITISGDGANSQGYVSTLTDYDLSLTSSGTGRTYVNSSTAISFIGAPVDISNLSGTGTRTVLADASGVLSAPVSDRTTKENIKPLYSAIGKIMHLKPVSFDYRKEFESYGKGTQVGFIAQDIKEILPNSTYINNSNGKMGYNEIDLVPLLVKAMQEQQQQIDELKKEIKKLKRK